MIALSEDLLHTMRVAARYAIERNEPLLTVRCLLLALAYPHETCTDDSPAGTLIFSTPDGSNSVQLSRDAQAIFAEGARRSAGRYVLEDLATALAAAR